MLTLLFGAAGTGKTHTLLAQIKADIKAGIPAFLVVPEQNTVSAEKEAARALPENAPLLFEVTNFTRLADTVFRRVGGIATRYADEGIALLLARDTAAALSGVLHDRRKIDSRRTREILAAIRECKLAAITPEELLRVSEETKDTPALSHKLTDLSYLLSGFSANLSAAGCALPTDGLAHLAEVLRREAPLSGAHFYFDGFSSFTALQREVITALLSTSPLTVALPMPPERTAKNSIAYAEVERTLRDLTRLAEEMGCEVTRIELTENRRLRSPLLRTVAERLFTYSCDKTPPKESEGEGALVIFEAATPYSEAEWVAADIARRVQAGAHYRDFAIIARDATTYRGVLDTALRRAGIPAYFSLPRNLTAFEPIKLIATAYAILTGGAQREDVITYLKCGLSGIPSEEGDRFELYAERLGLSGERLLYRPFTISPRGLQSPRSEKEKEEIAASLAALNATREALLPPLAILKEATEGQRSTKEHAAVLVHFLEALGVGEALHRRALALLADDEPERASEYARLYEKILEILDLLVAYIPDAPLSAGEFSDLLSLLFSTQLLKTIPSRADAVTVGSADLLRLGAPRHAYLIGVNEGCFPRSGEASGVFSSAEVARLAEHGIVLDGDALVQASREYHCFLRAFSAASESVTLSYTLADFSYTRAERSEVIARILAIAKESAVQIRESELSPLCRIYSESAAKAAIGQVTDGATRKALLSLLDTFPDAEAVRARATLSLCAGDTTVDTAVMARLYRGRMSLSQSRIDRYVDCPFSYFCEYVLRLSDDSPIAVRYAEVGSFVHKILEDLFATYDKNALIKMSDEELKARIDTVKDAYLAELFRSKDDITPRLAHRFSRLAARAFLLVKEFREEWQASDFTPLFFEYQPSETDESAACPPHLSLSDGTLLTLNGQIDRVDVFRKDGDAYLRVVDYKTGTKVFSLEDIRQGKNLQLLLYLFALWRTDRRAFAEKVGVEEGGRIIPAGALYLNLSLKNQHADGDEPLVKRSGILLHDPAILHAMDHEGEGKYVPLKLNPDGSPKKEDAAALATIEELAGLASEVEASIKGVGESLLAGRAAAHPRESGKKSDKSPCAYCLYYPICRRTRGKEEADD